MYILVSKVSKFSVSYDANRVFVGDYDYDIYWVKTVYVLTLTD